MKPINESSTQAVTNPPTFLISKQGLYMRYSILFPLTAIFSFGCSEQLSKDPNDNTTPTVTDPNEEDNDGDGFTENEGDCDDENVNAYPQAEEVCDGADNDCDDEIDEDAVDSLTWFSDEDRDGYGEAGTKSSRVKHQVKASVKKPVTVMTTTTPSIRMPLKSAMGSTMIVTVTLMMKMKTLTPLVSPRFSPMRIQMALAMPIQP